MPLEALSDVPWQDLDHAYGPAVDVPRKLRALLSQDPDDRMWAVDQLQMGLVHQYSVYPATPKIIPFLYELLSLKEVQDKASILELMRNCMTGWEETGEVMKEIQHNVHAGLHILEDLTRDEDLEVRTGACFVLGTLNGKPHEVSRILHEFLETEEDPGVRASIWIAVFDLWKHTLNAHQDTSYLEPFTPLAQQDLQEGEEHQRYAAALLSLVGGGDVEEALQVMLEAQEGKDHLIDLGWNDLYELQEDLEQVLKKRPEVRRQWMEWGITCEDEDVRHQVFLAIERMMLSERSRLEEGQRLLQQMQDSGFLKGLIKRALNRIKWQLLEVRKPHWTPTDADGRFAARAAEQSRQVDELEGAWHEHHDPFRLQEQCLDFLKAALKEGHIPPAVLRRLHELLESAGQLERFTPRIQQLYQETDEWNRDKIRPVVCVFCGLSDPLQAELVRSLEQDTYPGQSIVALELLGQSAEPFREVIVRLLSSDDRLSTRGWPVGEDDSIVQDEKYRQRLRQVLDELDRAGEGSHP